MGFLNKSPIYIGVAIVFISLAVFLFYKVINPSNPQWVTATVDRGNVSELVSISGFVEAKRIADLAFPSQGTVTDVLVEEGSVVKQGDVLATLAATQLVAQRAEAVSALQAAEANYAKTTSGPRTETIDLANTSLENAEENLDRVTREENKKVDNARTALLSTGLTAESTNSNEPSTAPNVTGTYLCGTEGTYLISVYSSRAKSGFSYTFTGPESGIGMVSTDQPAALGNCGLYLIFTENESYQGSEWKIEIPNTRGSSYATLNNNYNLALTQTQNSISQAQNALNLATKEKNLSIAPARKEDVASMSAAISQARARIAAIDAQITDRSVIAPFPGIVTKVSITKGESAPSSAVISVLADDVFVLKARVPEIDITKVKTDQSVRAVFDALSSETLTGKVTYISPVAIQIDGVAYFETTILLDKLPEWMRAGLNADIDIITTSKEQVLRIPKRFVTTLPDGSYIVLQSKGNNKIATTTVEVIFIGNDSYMEITGLPEGAVVIAP